MNIKILIVTSVLGIVGAVAGVGCIGDTDGGESEVFDKANERVASCSLTGANQPGGTAQASAMPSR